MTQKKGIHVSGPVRAIIWDFGGVLNYMADVTPRLELAQRVGVPLEQINALVFDSQSARRAAVGELTIGQHWQEVGAALGLPPTELPGFVAQFWAADVLNTQVVELIQALRPRYKIGLLSNAWDDLRQVLDERFHVAGLFDELVISAEVGLLKPDPRIYHLAVQRLGVQPAEAIFIDDVLVNVEAARREGLHAIQFTSFEQAQAELGDLLGDGPHPGPLPGGEGGER